MDQDQIAEPGYTQLHFNGDNNKTLIGGIGSLIVVFYMVYTGISEALRMFNRHLPYISSIEQSFDYEEIGKVSLLNMSKPLMMITDKDMDNSYEINE